MAANNNDDGETVVVEEPVYTVSVDEDEGIGRTKVIEDEEVGEEPSDEGYDEEEEDSTVVVGEKMNISDEEEEIIDEELQALLNEEIEDIVCDLTDSINQLKTQSHTNTKKISEMQYQFDDARIRIDKLLRRSTSHREYDYDLKSPIVLSAFDLSSDRKLERTNSTSTTGSSEPTTPTIHKTAVTVNPKKMLREVSITLKCQED